MQSVVHGGGSLGVQGGMAGESVGATMVGDSSGVDVSVHGVSVSVQSGTTAAESVVATTVGDSSWVDAVIATITWIWTRFLVWMLWIGNHPYAVWFWAILGVICSTLAPFFLVRSGRGLIHMCGRCYCDDVRVHAVVADHMDEVATWMLFGGIMTAMIYILGYLVRKSDFLRLGQLPWYFTSIGNGVMLVGSLYIGVWHHNTPAGIIAYTLLIVSILGLLEITRPVVDYGLLQTFTKMPILMCFMRYGVQWSAWIVPPCLLAVYGIIVLPWIQSHRLPHQQQTGQIHIVV